MRKNINLFSWCVRISLYPGIDIHIEACDIYANNIQQNAPTAPQAFNFMKRKRLLANAALRTHDEWLMMVFHCAQDHFARKHVTSSLRNDDLYLFIQDES